MCGAAAERAFPRAILTWASDAHIGDLRSEQGVRFHHREMFGQRPTRSCQTTLLMST